jgi:hypothetical protein
MSLPLERATSELARVACLFGGWRRVGNSDTAAGKAVRTGRAHRGGATIWKRVRLALQRTSRESAGMTHLASYKSRAQQKHAQSKAFHQHEAHNSGGPM